MGVASHAFGGVRPLPHLLFQVGQTVRLEELPLGGRFHHQLPSLQVLSGTRGPVLAGKLAANARRLHRGMVFTVLVY